MKKILDSSLLGQLGVNLIERIVLNMGFLWTPTGQLEAGIDGVIEIRNQDTAEVTNNIIQVQSKALSEFAGESVDSFQYRCSEKDLQYWLGGNAPVILVVSKPETNEAYWISIKEYFKDPARLKKRVIIFSKFANRFTAESRDYLIQLAVSRDSGIYLQPLPKKETLYSNLLEVSHYGPTVYVADTPLKHRWQVSDIARARKISLPSEWELWGKRIVSLNDLNEDQWDYICDAGSIESFSIDEWLFSIQADLRNLVLNLLHRALKRFLSGRGVTYDDNKECFFFKAKPTLSLYKYRYLSLQQSAARTVFQPYPKNLRADQQPSYYRHAACHLRFLVLGKLFLEVTPSWYFTFNGVHRYRFFEERLKGIKKLEKNAAILGQALMWSELLAHEPELFEPTYSFLRFNRLTSFELEHGINDSLWLPKEIDGGADFLKELGSEQQALIDED
jgi:Domain of unknown function (DUF4365)